MRKDTNPPKAAKPINSTPVLPEKQLGKREQHIADRRALNIKVGEIGLQIEKYKTLTETLTTENLEQSRKADRKLRAEAIRLEQQRKDVVAPIHKYTSQLKRVVDNALGFVNVERKAFQQKADDLQREINLKAARLRKEKEDKIAKAKHELQSFENWQAQEIQRIENKRTTEDITLALERLAKDNFDHWATISPAQVEAAKESLRGLYAKQLHLIETGEPKDTTGDKMALANVSNELVVEQQEAKQEIKKLDKAVKTVKLESIEIGFDFAKYLPVGIPVELLRFFNVGTEKVSLSKKALNDYRKDNDGALPVGFFRIDEKENM